MNPIIFRDIECRLREYGFSVKFSRVNEDIIAEHPVVGVLNLGAPSTAYAFILGYRVGRVVKSAEVLAAPAPGGCAVREEIL